MVGEHFPFSVADYHPPRDVVAGVILYDQLIVPVPSKSGDQALKRYGLEFDRLNRDPESLGDSDIIFPEDQPKRPANFTFAETFQFSKRPTNRATVATNYLILNKSRDALRDYAGKADATTVIRIVATRKTQHEVIQV